MGSGRSPHQQFASPLTTPQVALEAPRQGLTVLFTGLSSAGKSTLARSVYGQLKSQALAVELLDADLVRQSLCPDLQFTRADREENLRRIAFVAGLLTHHGVVTLVAAISPYRSSREAMRSQVGRFLEVFVDAPVSLCEQRDRVGLYRRFRAGEVRGLSGLDDPYERPAQPEVHCQTDLESVEQSAAKVTEAILLYKPS